MQTNTVHSITKQQVNTAIVLAGGLGTRLRSAVSDVPKCMAPVAGWPFLYYVIHQLRSEGIEKIIFSLGYKHEVILDFLNTTFKTLDYDFVIEDTPLGTGGAIHLAMQKTTATDVWVVNGDTLFKGNIAAMYQQHQAAKAACTLALKPMKDFDRYGVVNINQQNIITAFEEKKYYREGLINAGMYLIHKEKFLQKNWPEKFSFEKDYLEAGVNEGQFAGVVQDVYFIDIGIPQDYTKAQQELALPPLNLAAINKNWTLFLDRDGVINEDKIGSYIFNADEFEFVTGAPELFTVFTKKFKRIIVVTNQRGLAKGLMTVKDLEGIHAKMMAGVASVGSHISKIYFAEGMSDTNFMRKPNPGMALAAKHDFPDIDFSQSIMVGNNITDMQFARSVGIRTIYLPTTRAIALPNPYVDMQFENLQAFANAL